MKKSDFAPKHYHRNHFEFERRSGIPHGYFDPWWRRALSRIDPDQAVFVLCAVIVATVIILAVLRVDAP